MRHKAHQRRVLDCRAQRAGALPYLIESLEPRTLLAAVSWDGGGDGTSYHDPLNWDTDAVPGVLDDVTIDVVADPTITFTSSTGSRSVNSLICREAFTFTTDDTLSVSTTAELDATWTFGGGTLNGGTWDVSGGLLTMNGGGAGAQRIFTGVTVQGEIRALSNGTLVFNGGSFDTLRLATVGASVAILLGHGTTVTGDIISETSGGGTGHTIAAATLNATATFASSCEVVLAAGSTANINIDIGTSNDLTLINNGAIRCQEASRSLTIGNADMPSFTNNGTVEVTAGTLSINAASWSNMMNVVASGTSTLNVGGGIATGDLHLAGWSVASTATVHLTGALDNAGATLTLASNTGDWRLLGGSIVGGTVTYSDGASLHAGGNINNRIAAVDVVGDIVMDQDNGRLLLGVGARFAAVRLTGGGAHRIGCEAGYVLHDDIVVEGTGGGGGAAYHLQMATTGTLTIAATGSVSVMAGGRGMNIGSVGFGYDGSMTLVNQGLLSAEVAMFGASLRVNAASFTNEGIVLVTVPTAILEIAATAWTNAATGTISAAGGTMTLLGAWTNAGALSASGASSVLNLGGTFATSTLNLAGFTSSGGATINVTGTLTNAAQTLSLTAVTGSWNLHGGTIDGGTLSFTGGTQMTVTANDGTLNGVTISAGTMVLANGALPVVTGGLTLDGTISATAAGTLTGLSFSGTQSLTGTGSVVFNGTSSNNTVRPGTDGTTLTIGASITIRTGTQGGEVGVVALGRGVINDGTLWSQVAARTLTLTGNAVTNNGIVQASGGGTLTVAVTPTNFAAGTLTGGTWRALTGSTMRAAGVDVTTNAATIELNGAGSNFYNATTGTVSALAGLPSNAGTLTLANGRPFDFAPAGNTFVNSGTLTVTGAPGVTVPAAITFEHSGTIDGDGDVTFAGVLNWVGGAIGVPGAARGSGLVVIASGATLSVSGNPSHVLARDLTNNGSVNWTAGNVTLDGGHAFTNSGSFTISSAASLTWIAVEAGNAFNNVGSFTKQGTGTLQFGAGVTGVAFHNDGSVNVQAGTLDLDSGGSHTGDFALAAGAVLRVAGTHALAGASDLVGDGAVTVAGTLATAGLVDLGELFVADNASMSLPANGNRVLTVERLLIAGLPGAPTGTIDIADNAMIISEAPGEPMVERFVGQQIGHGYAGGSWGGRGITSALANRGGGQFALGYGTAGDLAISSFYGHSVQPTDVLVRYTRYGDSNLNGIVNLQDFNNLASNFGGTGKFWRQGDFNYDSIVNLGDFNVLAANFGTSVAPETEDWTQHWSLSTR